MVLEFLFDRLRRPRELGEGGCLPREEGRREPFGYKRYQPAELSLPTNAR